MDALIAFLKPIALLLLVWFLYNGFVNEIARRVVAKQTEEEKNKQS